MPDEPESIEYKGRQVFKVGGCQITVVKDAAGKAHFEGECLDKAARDELAAIFEEEAILRVNPKVKLEEPPVEPPAAPDTRLNPTES
ncbi:hypothetical protein ES705_47318 [subsurface metagenome]